MSEQRPVAPPDHTTQPWWDATREGVLMVQSCNACGSSQLYPRALCTTCGSTDLSFAPASGRGAVYSFTVVHRAPHAAFTPPYTVALVRLEEGPVVLTNLVDAGDVRCDMPVTLTWEDLPDGRRLPLFRPAPAERG
jgi:uncharacterized OB-fold protein